MPANYLHGVEIISVNRGPRPVNAVRTAVIALIGIAVSGPNQSLTLVQSESDASQFGVLHPDNTIRMALDAILNQGGATCIVVNVFDSGDHTAAYTETQTVTNGKVKLTKLYFDNLVVTKGVATLVLNTDYTYDAETQEITILTTTTYPDGTALDLAYDAVDLSLVTASHINGATVGNTRSGLQALDDCFNYLGFNPKILICPGFSQLQSVASEMITKADLFRAMALIDAPADATPTEAITGRGNTTGPVKSFFTSSKRAVLLYPAVRIENPYTGGERAYPYSPFFAGVMAKTDNDLGYWYSPSNKEIRGILRPNTALTAQINNPNTQVNLLNEKGIVTIFQSFGTGYRTWGNRSAAHPTVTTPDNFISVQRTADMIHESIEQAMLQFIDEPLNNATIDAIRETGNSFLRSLVQRGAIIDGSVTYDPAKNPPTQLAQGIVVFDIEFMPPTPAERIVFQSFINIALLASLQQAQ